MENVKIEPDLIKICSFGSRGVVVERVTKISGTQPQVRVGDPDPTQPCLDIVRSKIFFLQKNKINIDKKMFLQRFC